MYPLVDGGGGMFASPGAVKQGVLKLDLVPAFEEVEADLKKPTATRASMDDLGLVDPATRVGSLAPTPREQTGCEAGEAYENAKIAQLNKRFAGLGVIIERSPAAPRMIVPVPGSEDGTRAGSVRSSRCSALSGADGELLGLELWPKGGSLQGEKGKAIGFRRTSFDRRFGDDEFDGGIETQRLFNRIMEVRRERDHFASRAEGAAAAAQEAEAAARASRAAAETERRAAREAAVRVVAAREKLRALEAERALYRRRAEAAAAEAEASGRAAAEAEAALEEAGREREAAELAAARAEKEVAEARRQRDLAARSQTTAAAQARAAEEACRAAQAGAEGLERVAEAAVDRVKALAAMLTRAKGEREGAERAARAEEQRAGEAARRAAALEAELQRQRAAWAGDVRKLAREALVRDWQDR